jgi:hypothetical protein
VRHPRDLCVDVLDPPPKQKVEFFNWIDFRVAMPDFSWCIIPKPEKIFQMAAKYINIFHSAALQNLPKLGFLV